MPAHLTHILYLSYDGMTDPLGRSQVIPYLEGLAKAGYVIHLVSFEKTSPSSPEYQQIRLLLGQQGIYWTPLSYTKTPPVLSTLYDLNRMISEGYRLIRQHRIKLVHCRSYIAGLAGLKLKKKTGAAFLFDMRGFWADERVDGRIWDLKKPLYKKIYDYFKKKEKEMLREADGVISLTQAGKKVIDSWGLRTASQLPVEVIPCCADLDLFDPARVSPEAVSRLRTELNLTNTQTVVSYLGAIGTWYMLDEMLLFFKFVLKYKPDAVMLFITREPAGSITGAASRLGIPQQHIRIRPGKREEIPQLLSLSQISLFFITPAFSKTASSPTKQGEIMGMGIPVICNAGVGDTDYVVERYNSGMVIDLSDKANLEKAASKLDTLKELSPEAIRQGACEFYSLTEGVGRYTAYYRQILKA